MEADLIQVRAIVADAQALHRAGNYADAAEDLAKAVAMLEADPRYCRSPMCARAKGLLSICEILAKGDR